MFDYIFINVIKILKKKIPSLTDEKITCESALKEDIGINSILFYDLLIDLENEFQIIFKDFSMNSLKYKTIGDLCNTIKELIGEREND